MSTLTITIGILAHVITFLIGRHFRAEKLKELDSVSKDRDYCRDHISYYYSLNATNAKRIAALELSEQKLKRDLNECESLLYEVTCKFPKFELVPNKDKHPAANDNYLYIEGKINGNREAGLLKLSDWSKAKERLLKNPEDKPNN
jgi:hypothetical protein